MATTSESFTSKYVLVDAHVAGRNDFLFLAHDEASLQAQNFRCHVIRCQNRKWDSIAHWDWRAVGFTVRSIGPLRIDVLGRDGQVGTYSDGSIQEEHVDAGRAVGPFRGIDTVSGRELAYGMKRELYCRDAGGKWGRFDKGMVPPLPTSKTDISALIKQRIADIGGINAVVSGASDTLLAFGMRGEIWQQADDRWQKLDSPTNLMLKDATRTDEGTIYVCGQSGTVLKGLNDHWQPVSYVGPPSLDFCSICSFSNQLFLADGHSLRVLSEGELKLIDFGERDIVPSILVTCGPRQILSIAGQEAWVSDDGVKWKNLLE